MLPPYFTAPHAFVVSSVDSSTEMSSQTKLSSFFSSSIKKLSTDTPPKPLKKIKLDKENALTSDILKSDIEKELCSEDKLIAGTCLTPLQDENSELLSYCHRFKILDKRIGGSWFQALKNEFDKPYFKELDSFVTKERSKYTIFPPEDQVWSWTRQCSIDSIKVVILGQDPYHNPGQAHGLCFSVPPGIPPPPSLINMYKELETDIVGFKRPNHGYLVGWARQGVLLLNAVLTVRKNAANSHKDQGWENLTTAVIKYLNERNKGVVFLLWGAYAQKKASFVDKKKHFVLSTVHPSPLSASRGFFNCKHFSKCNEYLQSQNKRPIDWCKLPEK